MPDAHVSWMHAGATRRAAHVASVVSLLTGLSGLAGWWFNIPMLRSFWPGRPLMLPDCAFMTLLLGTALWLILREPESTWQQVRYRAGQLLAITAALIGLIALAEHMSGTNLVPNMGGRRPAFPSALSGAMLGLGMTALNLRVRGVWLGELLGVVTLQVALLGVMGHMFGVPELYGGVEGRPNSGMPVQAAVAYLFLALGLQCARADRGMMAVLSSHTPGGTMMRRWMFMPLILLLAMGILYLAMDRGGVVTHTVSSWALFMTCLVVLTVAVWATGSVLHRAGLERNEAHRTLERRVTERTAELHQANEALRATKEDLARANSQLERIVEERTLHLQETISSLQTVCYNIAHDLRAPNRAIAGFAQVLLTEHATQLDDTARDCLTRIRAAAQRSDGLTLDLLAYGRLGHAELPCDKQCLRTRVDHVIARLNQEITAAGAHVEIVDPLPWVWANSEALDQVLLNLVTNALKFVANGVQPRVRIRATSTGDYSRIFVEDNGIGIPAEHRRNIFGVFQRLHPLDKYPGSGIGLAIVQKGVERMGGKVGVDSPNSHGSCFWFELRTA